ncbi:MAG: hypothetical protein AB1899_10195 [Pseudomonadota bacterium]
METFSTPLVIYILSALSIAALISLSVMAIIAGEVGVMVYKRFFPSAQPPATPAGK